MFYLFHGDDTHSQARMLGELKSKLGDAAMLDLNTTRFEGQVDMGELRHACDSIPFLASKRLVIIQDLFARQPAKEFVDELLAYLPHLPPTTRLIFLESRQLPARHALILLVDQEETGYVRLFNRPEGNAVDRWIVERVEEQGSQIAPRAAHLLAANIGNDLHILENEIEKLVLYRGPGQTIEADHVVRLCPYAAEASIFDLVDALGNRDGRAAARLLQAKLDEGTEPFYLFSMIVRQFRLLIQIKALAAQGQRPPAIGKSLKLHRFVAEKLWRQAQQFSLLQLEQVYAHLLDIDVAVKSGRGDMITALNLLVAGLAPAL